MAIHISGILATLGIIYSKSGMDECMCVFDSRIITVMVMLA